jgi:hypothetical protein
MVYQARSGESLHGKILTQGLTGESRYPIMEIEHGSVAKRSKASDF